MSKSLSIALMLVLGASSMTVSAFAADEGAATQPVKKAKPKKICKTNPSTTGSRIAKRVCKTEEEWAEPADDQELRNKSQDY